MPEAKDYPDCLKHLLYRKIWSSTLGEIKDKLTSDPGYKCFIKPSEELKAFCGGLANLDEINMYLDGIPGVPELKTFPRSFPVHCSEAVKMVAEWRVYIVHGEIKAVCQYMGDKQLHGELDMQVVKDAVSKHYGNELGPCKVEGYAIDFGLFESNGKNVTGLIEVNDGFSLGYYEGLDKKDYTDVFIARWEQLVGGEK